MGGTLSPFSIVLGNSTLAPNLHSPFMKQKTLSQMDPSPLVIQYPGLVKPNLWRKEGLTSLSPSDFIFPLSIYSTIPESHSGRFYFFHLTLPECFLSLVHLAGWLAFSSNSDTTPKGSSLKNALLLFSMVPWVCFSEEIWTYIIRAHSQIPHRVWGFLQNGAFLGCFF